MDVHKQSLTAVAVDEVGRSVRELTVGSPRELVTWSASLQEERLWAVEDCRQLSGALERTLAALVKQLVVLSAATTVLMVVEDVHWIDPTLRELLDLIVDRLPELPVMRFPETVSSPHRRLRLQLEAPAETPRTREAYGVFMGRADLEPPC